MTHDLPAEMTAKKLRRMVECPDCEGTGDYLENVPAWGDPYRMVAVCGLVCVTCNGERYVPADRDEDEDEGE